MQHRTGAMTLGGPTIPKTQQYINAMMLAYDLGKDRQGLIDTINSVRIQGGEPPLTAAFLSSTDLQLCLSTYESLLSVGGDESRLAWFDFLTHSQDNFDPALLVMPPRTSPPDTQEPGMIWAIIGVVAALALILFFVFRSRRSGRR